MIDRLALSFAIDRNVSRETFDRLALIARRVAEESQIQNLVSASSRADLWQRHIVDSAQLLRYAEATPWLDLGTGAGFPGLVIAAFEPGPVILCEERRLRSEFLARVVHELGLSNVTIAACRLEKLETRRVATISARAFAALDTVFQLAHRFSDDETRWILPKGRTAHKDLALARRAWHGVFRLEPSVTDPDSSILIANQVRPRTTE